MFSKEEVANIDENPLRSCEQEDIALINVINISFQSKCIKQMASGLDEKISSLTEPLMLSQILQSDNLRGFFCFVVLRCVLYAFAL